MAYLRAAAFLGLFGVCGVCSCYFLREAPPAAEAPSLISDKVIDKAEDLRDPAEELALKDDRPDEPDEADEGGEADEEEGYDPAQGGADKKGKTVREKKVRDKSKAKDRTKKERDGKNRTAKKDGRDKGDRTKEKKPKAPRAKKESGPKAPVNPGPPPPPGDYEAAQKVAMDADTVRHAGNRDLAEAKYGQAIEAGKKLLGTSRAKDACLMLARCEHGLGAIWLVRKDWETALTHYKNSCHYYRAGGYVQRVELSGSGERVRQMEEKIRASGRPIPEWKPPS